MLKIKNQLLLIITFFAFLKGISQELKLNNDSIVGLTFSVQKFNDNIYSSLKDSAIGWSYSIWKDNHPVFEKSGGFKIIPADRINGTGEGFSINTRMHVASFSKTITAIAIAKLIEMKKINWDSQVKSFLPSTWKLHPLFINLTIRDLLTMKSGLDGPLDAVSSSFDSLRILLEKGPNVEKIGKFNYQNTSYGLLRIIIAYLAGFKEFIPDISNDAWAITTSNMYIKFINDSILQPAKITHADCAISDPEPAFRYSFPLNGQPGELTGNSVGVPDGNLTLYAGGFGWYLSVEDAGKLLNAVFYEKRILSPIILEQLTELNFPLTIRTWKYGNYFGTGGDWGHPVKPAGWAGIHAYFYCFPDNIRIIVFVNSGEGSPTRRILNAYKNAFN